MKKPRFLSLLCIVLLLSNIILAICLMRKNDRPRHDPDRPKRFIIEKLHFDAEQQKQYQLLIDTHRKSIGNAQHEMLATKNRLYEGLTTNTTTSLDPLTDSLAAIQKKIEKIHYEHFLDIRGLCREDQLPAFNELSKEIATLFSPPKKP
jgi:hypothetical protein